MSWLLMQQKRRRSAHSDSYWPGYVDALVNVVLNLMFLVAMLAVGSFVLGLEISRTISMPAMQKAMEKVRRIVDDSPIDGTSGSSNTIEVVDSPSPDASRSIRIAQVRNVENQTLLHVKFTANALRLNDSIRVDLIPRLREISRLDPEASFSIWAVSDADPQSRRVSFMRIMALKEALNNAGVQNSRVATRILQGTNTTTNGQLVYVLVRSTQNRKETDDR